MNRITLAFGLGVVASTGAWASFLSEYNLIALGDLRSSGEVDGSAIIVGNIDQGSASNYAVQGVTASNGDGLVLGGDLNVGVNINNGGNFRVSSTTQINAFANQNGGGQLITDPSLPSFLSQVSSEVRSLNTGFFANLATNSAVQSNGNNRTFDASPTGPDQVAVFSISSSLFATPNAALNLNLNGAESVIINVDGSATGGVVTIGGNGSNFVGGFSQSNSSKILFNFLNTSSIIVNTNVNGTILAPDADLRNLSGINGTVVVNDFQKDAEVRRFTYGGVVPAPGAAALLGVAGFAIRRRRAA